MEKNLGSLIKEARIKANLSQAELADLCEMSQTSLFDLENGLTKNPRPQNLKALAQHLNLEFKKLVQIDDSTLGGAIRYARLEANLSQKDLAQSCIISLSQLCNIEKNIIKKPHLLTLQALAQQLNISLEKLKRLSGYKSSCNLSDTKKETLGNFIRKKRLQMELSLEEVSIFSKLTVSCLDCIESGKTKKPHIATLKILSDALQLDLTKLKELAGYDFSYTLSSTEEENLGIFIKNARLEANISRKTLAQLCQISEKTLLYIESGKAKTPQISTLKKLAKNLELDLDKLKALSGYDNNQENLAIFIKQARLEANFSSGELSKACNLSINTLHYIESGKAKKPQISTLKKISTQLNLDFAKMLELAGYSNNLENKEENLPNFIKKARLEAGFSIKQLAKLCQISNDNLKCIENGKTKKPNLLTLKALADILNLDFNKVKKLAGFDNVQEIEQETLANLIEEAQLKAELSTNQLAKLCQIPSSVLYNIKSGKTKKPNISTLKVLAEQLNLDLDKLTHLAGKNDQENLGDFIKNARLKAGLSSDEAAKLCQLSPRNISNIETGKTKNPNILTLQRLATYLKLDFDKMLELAGYKNNLDNAQKNLGTFVKESRLKARLSLEDLAQLCNVSNDTFRCIESGKVKKPHLSTLESLFKTLNLDLNKLMELAGYIDTSESNQETLPSFIKKARLKAKLSLKDLAQLCNVSNDTFRCIELGKVKKPHLSTLEILSKTLNLDLNKLKMLAGYNDAT